MKFLNKQNLILTGVVGALTLMTILVGNNVFAADTGGGFGAIFDKLQGLGANAVSLLSTWFYVGGVALAGWGLWDWYQSGQQGSQVKMKNVVLKLAAGICLVALPFIMKSGIETIGGNTTGNGRTSVKSVKDDLKW